MKNERVFKNFSALSFDGNAVTGESGPAPSVSQPRLTPESVQDFNVHQDGSADSKLPQPERSGRQGSVRGGARLHRLALDSAQAAARKGAHPDAVASSEEFREMLYQRSTASYVSAIPYHRWGINE